MRECARECVYICEYACICGCACVRACVLAGVNACGVSASLWPIQFSNLSRINM